MGVCIKVGSIADELGAASFVHSFFSTVSVHGEPSGWGTRFPHLMNELYEGRLPVENASLALKELLEAKAILSNIPPSKVVWDFEDRAAQPPWGGDIAESITDLGNYFVSSTGRDLFELLEETFRAAIDENRDATIESY
jgi:hypothetical protein